jgi:hypothetical protein
VPLGGGHIRSVESTHLMHSPSTGLVENADQCECVKTVEMTNYLNYKLFKL